MALLALGASVLIAIGLGSRCAWLASRRAACRCFTIVYGIMQLQDPAVMIVTLGAGPAQATTLLLALAPPAARLDWLAQERSAWRNAEHRLSCVAFRPRTLSFSSAPKLTLAHVGEATAKAVRGVHRRPHPLAWRMHTTS